MVDDILTVTNVKDTATVNELVNTFIDQKKLRLSHAKCVRIHLGKGHLNCPQLKVHEKDMREAEREKYLGDIVDQTGKINVTIHKRVSKGEGIKTEIVSIINEIPFGKHKVEVALKLREAMLVNGILFNSEAWHGVTSAQIVKLEKVDEALLREILQAHSKTPTEFLYLETGTVPLRWIIAQRRINFMKHIVNRHDEELLKKVFLAQREQPTRGDFVELVTKDLKDIGITYEEAITNQITKQKLKELSKLAAFTQLLKEQKEHSKVRQIKYEDLTLQPYLKNEIF